MISMFFVCAFTKLLDMDLLCSQKDILKESNSCVLLFLMMIHRVWLKIVYGGINNIMSKACVHSHWMSCGGVMMSGVCMEQVFLWFYHVERL